MDFVIQWVWYLAAFAVGSHVAWLIGNLTVKSTTDEQGPSHADESGAR